MKILIVDDEAAARKKIRSFLSDERNATIIEAGNGEEAVQLIEADRPDLIFLDIQMPRMTGFEVIDAVGADMMPAVVFVTAYDQYALDAFEVQAVDYLLKPYDQERFLKSFARAKERIELKSKKQESLEQLLSEIRKNEGYLQRVTVREGARFIFVPVAEILYFSSDEKYVELHTANKKHLVRETIANLEQRLDPEKFVRIHRMFILNIGFLQEIQPWSHGDCIAILKNGEKLSVSRRFRGRLLT
jgi:two-component system, LytTR family, response regulator